MTIMNNRKKELMEELKDKEYRDEYVSSSVDVGVAFQIKALREQREWNQTKFAKEAGMQQARISVLENPSHSPTLETLKKLAAAFDVGLIVKFVPIGELVKRELNLINEPLIVPSFADDPYFKEQVATKNTAELWNGCTRLGKNNKTPFTPTKFFSSALTQNPSTGLTYDQKEHKHVFLGGLV